MDNTFNSEAISSSFQIFRDVFAPQPQPRIKAWERAPVAAHAPRLRGQKIWKKAGIKEPCEDKENFESATAELEKSGTGARKKRRVMGAKDNISEAQWQMIEKGTTNANVIVSPKKKGRESIFLDDEDALLVPRKRTNTNHLITPRKSLRKKPVGNNLELVVDVFSNNKDDGDKSGQKVETSKKLIDEMGEPHSSDDKIVHTTDIASDEPQQRRRSLRRSSRRLTQSNERMSQDTELGAKHLNTSLSVVVWSAPAFEIFQAQNVARSETQPRKPNASISVEVIIPNGFVPEDGPLHAKEGFVLPLEHTQPTSDRNLENASGENRIIAPLKIDQDLPNIDNVALQTSRRSPISKALVSQDGQDLTPNRASKPVSAPVNDTVRNHQSMTPVTSTRLTTPKSTKSAPRAGLRRSLQTPRIKSFVPLAADAAPGEAFMNETSPNVKARPINELGYSQETCAVTADQAQLETTVELFEPAAVFEDVTITTDTSASSENGHLIPCKPGFMEDMKPEEVKGAASPVLTPAKDPSEDLELESTSNVLPLDPVSPLGVKIDSKTGIIFATAKISSSTSSTKAVSPLIAQSTAISMDHIVNLFPAIPNDKYDRGAAQAEALQSGEKDETPDAVLFSPAKSDSDGCHSEQQRDNAATSFKIIAPREAEAHERGQRPLVDHDDTDLLRDFVTRVKASRAAKTSTNIPRRKRSLPHSPLRLPLGDETNSSPSADTKDDEFDVGEPASPPSKRRKRNDPSLEADELAGPSSPRRSRRTRLPVKKSLAAPSFIPVRRLGQEGDSTVTLRQSEEKELAALTRFNTRKNKGAAVFPANFLALKAEEKDDPASRQKALKEVFDQKKKEHKRGKTVVWAEELARYQTDEVKKEIIEPEIEKAKVVEEKKAVRVGVRSKMSLGMAVNGTPAPKRKTKGRHL